MNIPQELKNNASFCVWKMEKRQGKPTKVPYNPKTGALARTNDPSTFSDFGTAMKTYALGGWDGIGYRVSEGIGAIDIDHCIREDGSLNDVAASIMSFFPDAYFERSPSGTGLRGFFRLSPDFAYINSLEGRGISDELAIAVYEDFKGRFLTIYNRKGFDDLLYEIEMVFSKEASNYVEALIGSMQQALVAAA